MQVSSPGDSELNPTAPKTRSFFWETSCGWDNSSAQSILEITQINSHSGFLQNQVYKPNSAGNLPDLEAKLQQ